jgi:hypothetical protein
MNQLLNLVVVFPLLAISQPETALRPTLIAEQIVDCNVVAEDVLSKTGGRLLSLRPHPDRCTITVLVPKSGERPHKVVVRVSKAVGDQASE